jgi:hypothetical protein
MLRALRLDAMLVVRQPSAAVEHAPCGHRGGAIAFLCGAHM